MSPEYQPRRARPGETFTYTDLRSGGQVDIQADDTGVVTPGNPQEAALLDGFDLPVSRKALAERKAEQKEGES